MAIATDVQVQKFVNERMRRHMEQAMRLLAAFQEDLSVIEDIYNACNQQSPTWTDVRPDGPPHLVTPNDVLAYNTFITDIVAAINGNGQLTVVRRACVQNIV